MNKSGSASLRGSQGKIGTKKTIMLPGASSTAGVGAHDTGTSWSTVGFEDKGILLQGEG